MVIPKWDRVVLSCFQVYLSKMGVVPANKGANTSNTEKASVHKGSPKEEGGREGGREGMRERTRD